MSLAARRATRELHACAPPCVSAWTSSWTYRERLQKIGCVHAHLTSTNSIARAMNTDVTAALPCVLCSRRVFLQCCCTSTYAPHVIFVTLSRCCESWTCRRCRRPTPCVLHSVRLLTRTRSLGASLLRALSRNSLGTPSAHHGARIFDHFWVKILADRYDRTSAANSVCVSRQATSTG